MRIGNLIFKLSEEDDLPIDVPDSLPVPRPSLPTFNDEDLEELGPEDYEEVEQEEPTFEIEEGDYELEPDDPKEDISGVPGVKYPPQPKPIFEALTPGVASGMRIEDIVESYSGPLSKLEFEKAAAVAKSDPKSYYLSHRYRYVKDRAFDPITAWVLDNMIIPDKSMAIGWLETQNKRSEPAFEPYIHDAFVSLVEGDPLILLAAENVWKAGKIGNRSVGFLPALFESSLRAVGSDDSGRVMINDALSSKLQSLGREIGRRGDTEFFQNRAAPVLDSMIDLNLNRLMNDKSRSKMEKRTELGTLKQWRRQLKNINTRIDMSKEASVILFKLAQTAGILDQKGEYEVASQLDEILDQIKL